MISEAIDHCLDRYAKRRTIDPTAEVSRALTPRMLLAFGVVPPADEPGCQTIVIDDPRRDGQHPGRSVDEFFASKVRHNIEIGRNRRPAYFDLAIIGPDYRLSERRRILTLLRPTAHGRSAVLLLRRATATPRRSVREAAAGLSAGFRGLEIVAMIGETPALLIGDLDLAQPIRAAAAAKRVGVSTTRRSLDRFVRRHRIDQLVISARPAIVADAPHAPSTIVRPGYIEIGRAKDFATRPVGVNQRSLGRWWGRETATLPVAVRRFDDGLFLPANGPTEACLFDADGRPVATSFLRELGYGTDLAAATLENPATCVIGPDGRWRPIQDAGQLRSGEKRSGDFYHFGLRDGRFGHFLVENLPRAWALDWALARGMRILVWGQARPFHDMAFAMLGVPPERIEIARPGVTYERVFSPDPAFRMMGSISPLVAPVWRRLVDAAFGDAPRAPCPEPFLYLSRKGVKNRRLVNETALEELLVRRGGRILKPETISFDAQIRAVASARAIVGCFGSQLHLSMFQQPGARKLVIAGEQFLGPDETLISLAAATDVAYYVEPVSRRRSSSARIAAWSVDLDRFGRAFDAWLERIEAPAGIER